MFRAIKAQRDKLGPHSTVEGNANDFDFASQVRFTTLQTCRRLSIKLQLIMCKYANGEELHVDFANNVVGLT